MTLLEIIRHINKLESIKEIVLFRLKEIDLWPTLRINIYGKIHASEYAENISEDKKNNGLVKSSYNKFTNLVLLIKNIITKFDLGVFSLSKVDVLLLSDGVSFVPQGNGYVDKLCNQIDEYLTTKKYKTTVISPNYIKKNIFAVQKLVQFESLISLLSIWYKISKPFTDDERHQVRNIVDKINEQLNDECIDEDSTLSSVTHILKNIIIFQYILKKTQPSVVFVVEYYSTQGQAMVYLCKSLGIKCIDLQHGTTYDAHPAYTRWETALVNNYNTIPDGFFVWNNVAKSLIEKWFRGNVYWGTNLYFEQYINSNINNEFQLSKKARYESEKYKELLNRKCKKIVVTLQPQYFTVNKIYNFLINNEWMQGYCWLVRLHPCMLGEIESAKTTLNQFDNVELECSSKNILFDVLKVSDLHLTYFSSSTLEAAMFSVPSIIFDSSGIEICKDHMEPECYKYIGGLHTLTNEIIVETLKNNDKNTPPGKGSNERLQRAFKEIDKVMSN